MEKQEAAASAVNSTATPNSASVRTGAAVSVAAPPPTLLQLPARGGGNHHTYGKVVLRLQNCLLPEDKLAPTPSQVDGLDADTENDLRVLGCELVQTAGILLRLPQVAMATGQVLFQRFYYSKSFVRHPMETTAMGCVCLASKIEEAPRRIRDVINVFHHIKQVKSGKTIQPMILDQNYIALKNQVIKAERRVLKELGFCVHVKHPHKIIVMYLQVLGYEKHANLMQMSWNYMNDSLRTEVFVRHHPETIACSCIYLSARQLKIPLPKNPTWFHIFGVQESDVQEISIRILKLYTRTKPNAEELEKKVEELRKTYQEARLRAKGQSEANTPAGGVGSGFSPSSRQASPDKNGSPTDAKKNKGESGGESPRYRRNNHHARSQSRSHSASRSRSRSPVDKPRKSHKKSRSHERRKKMHRGRRSYSHSRSPSISPPKSKKGHREKNRYRSRSRSHERERERDRDRRDRSRSRSHERYERYDKYYDKFKSKSGKHRGGGDEEHGKSRSKDRR